MAIQKPSIPKGTRDFGQKEMARRNYIFNTIRSVFRTYGYQEIQTPAQENLSTLMGKYGEEGDKLLFRILNSGDAFADVDFEKPLTTQVCEKGLRYDLTVPFARYVVQHQNEISFPFKRFQIQPVWRADRPQKGRYREFYQCDVDVIGSRSQVNELELVQMVDAVFGKLNVRVGIHINNRKVLTGFAEIAGAPDKVVDITVAIDKLDKIGLDKVKEEMADKGLQADGIAVIEQILSLTGSFEEKLAAMDEHDRWVRVDGGLYYFNSRGSLVSNGWAKVRFSNSRTDLKWSYWINTKAYYRQSNTGVFTDDYCNQTFWASFKIHRMLPKAARQYYPSWLAIAAGLSIDEGVFLHNKDITPHREVYIALDYDLEAFRPQSRMARTIVKYLNYFKLPAPTVQVYPEFHWYLLYPIKF